MNTKILTGTLLALATVACTSYDNEQSVADNAPTISPISALTASANLPVAPVKFTVSDEAPERLTYELISDNAFLVDEAGMVVGGSGVSRNLMISPEDDQVGDAYITIVVTDPDGLSASSSFLFSVSPEQASLEQFVRSRFVATEDDDPDLVNAIEFDDDAGNVEFDDLLED